MKTNWVSVISTLSASGMTYAEIGTVAGVAVSTVGDLATGRSKSPRFEAAIKLQQLYKRVLAKQKQASEQALEQAGDKVA